MCTAANWALETTFPSPFGAFITLLMRRVHFLALFGLVSYGAVMVTNSLAPTVQYAVCCLACFSDLTNRFGALQAPAAAREKTE